MPTLFLRTATLSFLGFVALVSCAPAQVGQATVQLRISPGVFSVGSVRKEAARFGQSGLAPTAYCYFINVTGSGLFQPNGKMDSQYATCADGTPNFPGLGQVTGLYAYGDTATLTVSAGDARRFDLVGVPVATLPGGTCSGKLVLSPMPGVVLGSGGDDVAVTLNGVSITNNFDVTLIASGSASINPGNNTVTLTAPASPHYGCGDGGGDNMNVYPFLGSLSSPDTFMSVSCPTGVVKVSATFPSGTTLAGVAATGLQTATCGTQGARFEALNFTNVVGVSNPNNGLSIPIVGLDSSGNQVGDKLIQPLGVYANRSYPRLGSYSGSTFTENPVININGTPGLAGQMGSLGAVDDASNASSDKWVVINDFSGGTATLRPVPVTFGIPAVANASPNQLVLDTTRTPNVPTISYTVGQAFLNLVGNLTHIEFLQDNYTSVHNFLVSDVDPTRSAGTNDVTFFGGAGHAGPGTQADSVSAYDNGVFVSADSNSQTGGVSTTSFMYPGGAVLAPASNPDMRINGNSSITHLLVSAPLGTSGPVSIFSYGSAATGSFKIVRCSVFPQCLTLPNWGGIQFTAPGSTAIVGMQFVKASQTLVVLLQGTTSSVVTPYLLPLSNLVASDFGNNAFNAVLIASSPKFTTGHIYGSGWLASATSGTVQFIKALNPLGSDQNYLSQTLMAGGYYTANSMQHAVAFRSIDSGLNWYKVYDAASTDQIVKPAIIDAAPITQRYCHNNGSMNDPNCSQSGDSYRPSAAFALLENWFTVGGVSSDANYPGSSATRARILMENGSGF